MYVVDQGCTLLLLGDVCGDHGCTLLLLDDAPGDHGCTLLLLGDAGRVCRPGLVGGVPQGDPAGPDGGAGTLGDRQQPSVSAPRTDLPPLLLQVRPPPDPATFIRLGQYLFSTT